MKLIPLNKEDDSAFMEACQASFSLAVQEEKDISEELIPPDEDLLKSLQHPDAQSFFIEEAGEIICGVSVQIVVNYHNHLNFST